MSCGSESPLASPNKRLKYQLEVTKVPSELQHLNQPESFEDNQSVSCGICYADREVSFRGEIDCCNHYFCFVCIMEWAKHESRCPICRQRFSNIHRQFPSSRVIKVPLRDQVYHPYGNMTTGPVDPYAEVQCSVCHGREDDSLLMLCDLCDTASHTYCVGLGYNVPDGDWFCHDCMVSRAAHDNSETNQQNDMPKAEPIVTIFDIVRESDSQVVRRPRASPSQQNQSSSSVFPLADRVSRYGGKNTQSGARTLHHCRYVQRNIQAFRENWNALRSGSLRFYCKLLEPGCRNSQKQNSDAFSHDKSEQAHSMASTSFQQCTVQVGSCKDTFQGRSSEDVCKAWKMMDRAKMMRQTHHSSSSISKGLDHPPSSGGARKVTSVHCNYQEVRSQQSRTGDLSYTRMEKQYKYSTLDKELENHLPPKLGEQKQIRDTFKEQTRSACLVTSVGSAFSHGKHISRSSSSSQVDLFSEIMRPAKSCKNGNSRKSEDAKCEIQSLVKLNLKVLSKDKQLGVDAFKGIAREATHTILAACRSEHQKSTTHSSSSVCSHSEDIQKFHKSSLMPNCCRQCFYIFVKNVVDSVMLENMGCG